MALIEQALVTTFDANSVHGNRDMLVIFIIIMQPHIAYDVQAWKQEEQYNYAIYRSLRDESFVRAAGSIDYADPSVAQRDLSITHSMSTMF